MAKGTAVRALSAGVGLLLIFAGPAQAGMRGDVMKFPEKYPLKKGEADRRGRQSGGRQSGLDAGARPETPRVPSARRLALAEPR